ncbi:hypothetical protein [Streptomyces sp. KLMMK]
MSTRTGPPTPDDMDELFLTAYREGSFRYRLIAADRA